MVKVRDSIEVAIPCGGAYRSWLRAEEYPHFMNGVEAVHPVGDRRFRWRGSVNGETCEWETEITDNIPCRLISWRGDGGFDGFRATVRLSATAGGRTRVEVEMVHEPLEPVSNLQRYREAVARRLHGDLERFREYAERRWRDGEPEFDRVDRRAAGRAWPWGERQSEHCPSAFYRGVRSPGDPPPLRTRPLHP